MMMIIMMLKIWSLCGDMDDKDNVENDNDIDV